MRAPFRLSLLALPFRRNRPLGNSIARICDSQKKNVDSAGGLRDRLIRKLCRPRSGPLRRSADQGRAAATGDDPVIDCVDAILRERNWDSRMRFQRTAEGGGPIGSRQTPVFQRAMGPSLTSNLSRAPLRQANKRPRLHSLAPQSAGPLRAVIDKPMMNHLPRAEAAGMAGSSTKPSIFFSYAHEDEPETATWPEQSCGTAPRNEPPR